MVDTQLTGHGLRLHPCRRCRDDNGMTSVLVGAHQLPCPMKERSGNFLGEQLFPELHKVVFGASAPTPDSLQDQVFERHLLEGTAERGTQRSHELVRSEFEFARAVSVERASRVALDQSSVEVEEGGDSPTARSRLDALDELIDRDHRRCCTGHLILTSSSWFRAHRCWDRSAARGGQATAARSL